MLASNHGSELSTLQALDSALLSALHGECFAERWEPALFASVLGTPGGYGFLARRALRPLGFILCRTAASEGEILSLGVLMEARRLGLGRSLVAAAKAEALKRGIEALFLEVAEDNAPALALYCGVGFRSVGRRPAYYQQPGAPATDALTLQCIVAG
jgi:ribosomal-protein-alanine N-acetyltransferase